MKTHYLDESIRMTMFAILSVLLRTKRVLDKLEISIKLEVYSATVCSRRIR